MASCTSCTILPLALHSLLHRVSRYRPATPYGHFDAHEERSLIISSLWLHLCRQALRVTFVVAERVVHACNTAQTLQARALGAACPLVRSDARVWVSVDGRAAVRATVA